MFKSSPVEVALILEMIIKWINRVFLWTLCCCAYPIGSMATEAGGLDNLSIEELMDSKVISATRTEQQLTDTAAAAYVITQDDIRPFRGDDHTRGFADGAGLACRPDQRHEVGDFRPGFQRLGRR
jgi:hypothetical protein